MTMHSDQIAIPDEVVRALVDTQFPDWRDLPVRRLATAGTANAIFRIGDGLAARLPLRPGDPAEVAGSLRREAAAAATLAEHSPFPVPRPVAIGAPGPDYPLPWSVQTWLPGITATDADPGGSVAFAEDLATLIMAIRQVDTRGKRFVGEGRGGHLPAHDAWMESCLRESEGLLDVTRARALWARLRNLPDPGRDVMSHKDLIPGNLLVAGGRLAGILDTGDFGPADPALDLVAAWHLLEAGPRAVLRVRLGSDETEWERGKAWALQQAMGLPWYYASSNPPMSALGLRTLERIFAASAALYGDDDFSESLSLLEVMVRVNDVVEAEYLVDDRSQRTDAKTGRQECRHTVHYHVVQRVLEAHVAEVGEGVHRIGRRAGVQHADRDKSAAWLGRPGQFHQARPHHRVKDDVGADPIGVLMCALNDVVLISDDDGGGAGRQQVALLARVATDRDRNRSDLIGDLDSRQADPARRGGDQDMVAGPHTGFLDKPAVGGGIRHP